MDVEDSLECHGTLTDEAICASVLQEAETQPDSDDEENEDPSPSPKPGDAIQALSTLRAFMETHVADFSSFYTVKCRISLLVEPCKGLFSCSAQ